MPYFGNNDNVGNADSTIQEKNYQKEFKENTVALSETAISTTQNASINHVPLRLLMNPRGKIRDITSVGDTFNTETGLLSPDKCAELITALQTQKGKGAELFAKRRRKSEKWVVDASNTGTQSPSGLPDYHQQQVKSPTSPSILPAYSDAGKHRVQLNLHQEQVLEKYVKPGLKVLKTPWEAALETGSASSAFVEDKKQASHHIPTSAVSSAPISQYQHVSSTVPDSASYNDGYTADYNTAPSHKLPQARFPTSKTSFSSNTQRDLAYKPSLPQGWKSPCVTLPKGNKTERLKRDILQNNKVIYNKEGYQEMLACNRLTKTTPTREVERKPINFIDCLIRSPELRISPIPPKDLLLYNNAIIELKENCMNRHLHSVEQQEMFCKNLEIEDNAITSTLGGRIKVPEHLQRLESNLNTFLEGQKKGKKPDRQQEQRMQRQQQLEKQTFHLENIQEQKDQQEKEEEYVKVAVHELISNYEQQLVDAERRAKIVPKNKNYVESSKIILKSSTSILGEIGRNQLRNAEYEYEHLQTTVEELYLPKAISLESYAPPPVVNIKEPETYNSSWKLTSTSSPSSFPLNSPIIGGFLSCGFIPPPKHQYFKPDSYSMGQQEKNPNVPQISYNPSPLSYDKISKFENTSEEQAQDNNYIPQIRRLPIQNHCTKALNASPVLFGEIPGTVGRSSSPYPYNTTKSVIYDRATTTFYSKRHNINELLHGQNYNNTARGWQSRENCDYPLACDGSHAELNGANYRGYRHKSRASADNLPYTDF